MLSPDSAVNAAFWMALRGEMGRGRRRSAVGSKLGALLVGVVLTGLVAGCALPQGASQPSLGQAPPPMTTPPVDAPPIEKSGSQARSGYPPAQRTSAALRSTLREGPLDGTTVGSGSRATVSIFAPGEDAPGAAMLSIVTARGVERREDVRFEVSLGRRSGQCVGEQWTHSGGRSQACWVVVPKAIGTHQITAFADIRAPDGNHHHTATAARPVSGKGPVTDQVTEQERDRIHRCGNTTDRVWLTFDDGFVSKTTMNSMLATLARENVKARFFATGQWAQHHTSWLATLRRAGHLIGNHSATHEWLNTLDDVGLRHQISRGPQADPPRLLRPGFGGGAFSATVRRVAASLGYQVCFWTVDPRDWDGVPAEQLISTVMQGNDMTPPLRPGGIVLMHMTGKHTAQALPGLIAAIRAKGLQLEPLR